MTGPEGKKPCRRCLIADIPDEAALRQIIREELAAALTGMEYAAPMQKNLTAADTQDDLSILEDLELFG